MRVKVYQIDADKDRKILSFENYRKAMSHGGVDPSIYKCVFHGDIDGDQLEKIYEAFNEFNRPYIGTFQGHSISISDVVEVTKEQPEESPVEIGCYFCDSFGWKKIEFDTSQCAQMTGLRVLMLLPGKPPVETRVIDELSHWQKAVSCSGENALMEVTYPFKDDVRIVSNEESKLNGMEGNRRINGGIYAGPMYLVNDNHHGGFRDLTDKQIAEYSARFAQPEDISPEEVQEDCGFTFIAW